MVPQTHLSLLPQCWGYKYVSSPLAFLHEFWRLNLGPHVDKASTLLTAISPPYFRDFEHCLFSLNFNSFSIIFLHGVLAWSWLNVAYNEIKHIVLWDHFWSVSQKGAMTLSFCFFLPFLFVCFRWSLLMKIQFYRMVFNQSHDFSVICYRNSHFKSCKIYLVLKNLYKDRSFVCFQPPSNHRYSKTKQKNVALLFKQ